MTSTTLHGVDVRFPFEPYEVQKAYMEKVIECLQNGVNGILESPTGTGKTLCLLCSSLAWLETAKAKYAAMRQGAAETAPALNMQLAGATGSSWTGDRLAPPKIIYSSRTHSQLSQAISEFKRTKYKYMKMAVIGSRDQMCVHPEVSKETNNNTKVQMCQIKVKSKHCHYYNQVDAKKDDPELRKDVLDIEDLVAMGKKRSFCPYYMTKELKRDADIIFMPYNYLLDPKTRKANGVELAGNIVIFDEAHNVEKMCEEAASQQFSSTDLALCIDEVTQVMKKNHENTESEYVAANSSQGMADDFSPDDLYTLKALFLELEKAIDTITVPAGGAGAMFPGGYMFELLGKADITPTKKSVIIELLDKLIQFLTVNSSSPYQRKGVGLQKFLDLINTVFSRDFYSPEQMELVKRSYKVYVSIEEPKKKMGGLKDGWNTPNTNTLSSKTGRLISYWCFHPGFGMQYLVEEGSKCVILTSGTLSPLSSFASELQVPFPVQLENPHIIKKNQVWVGAICNGPDGFSLNSSFKNRSDPRYKRSLGQTILNLSRVIPDGLLVFFPSYTVMRDCQEEWQNSGVWSKLSERKPIFVEPKIKDEFLTAMQEYYERIKDPAFSGACFMAVCRGKVSEGLDFADRNGRAVIITGLPYPPLKDPRVMLKQKYLDEARLRRKHGLTGQTWYSLEASRAVNQAVGRVIRHKDDYGAVILCDSRFAENHFKTQLSAWIRPFIMNYNKFGPVMKDITQFFRQALTMLPQPKYDGVDRPPAPTSQFKDSTPFTSDPAGAQGLQAVDSRPATSRSMSKRPSEAQGTEDNSSEYKSYLKYPKEDPAKSAAKSDKSLFSLLDHQVEAKVSEFSFSAPPPVPDYHDIQQNKKRRRIKIIPRVESAPVSNRDADNASEDVLKPENAAEGVSSCSGEAEGLCRETSSSEGGVSKHILKPLNAPEVLSSGFREEDREELCHPMDPEDIAKKAADDKINDKKKKMKAIGAYIMEVKAVVPREKYVVFASAIKTFKSTNDFETLMTVFPTVFNNTPQHQALIAKFQIFLKKEDKIKFQASLAEMAQS